MPSKISTILHRATRGNRPLNILCGSTHERYQTGFEKCNANFYLFNGPEIKTWEHKYAPLPNNHIQLIGDGLQQIPIGLDFDLILSQHKFGQFQLFSSIAQMFNIPLISLEHTLPMKNWGNAQLMRLKNMKGNINVFISEYSRGKWGWNDDEAVVVHHGVDTELFTNYNNDRKNNILSVVNDWVNRDWCCNFQGWQRITNGLPVFPVGSTPGLSKPATDTKELIQFYNNSRIFINTSTVSPVPTALLEAMSCGCAIITTATCMIPEIIQDGYNGFISNDEGYLRQKCIELLNNEDLAKQIGYNARKTILEKFRMEKFVQTWDNVFEAASNINMRGF